MSDGATKMETFAPNSIIEFDYINYKGAKELRKVKFICVQFGSNEYHSKPQLFLYCFCLERMAYRSFATKDINVNTIKVYS